MIKICINKKPSQDWNDNLKKSEYGSVYQTKEFGVYGKEHMSSQPLYLTFYDEKQIVGQLLLFQTVKGLSKILKLFGRGFIYNNISKIGFLPKHIFWIFGPIIFDTKFKDEVLNSLGNFIISKKCTFKGTCHPLMNHFSFNEKFNFREDNLGTFIISLSNSIEDILKNTDKKSVQKNIKRSQERGVKISQIKNKKDLILYCELLNEFRKSNNLETFSLKNIVEGYNLLKDLGHIGFLAWYEEKLIGGVFISTFNNFINEWGIVSSNFDRQNKLYCIDYLRWKIIEWGKKNGLKYYDLSGIKLSDRTNKEEGIFKNKMKWGGELFQYISFTNKFK